MKTNKYEYVQRIKSKYVGDDCVQIMVPFFGEAISILDSNGVVYYHNTDDSYYVNKYFNDPRKENFPYHNITVHKEFKKLKKVQYISQILDFNKVYIKLHDDLIIEQYAMKDGDEALVVTKLLSPKFFETKYLNRNDLDELCLYLNKHSNNICFSKGIGYKGIEVMTEQEILNDYKQQKLKQLIAEMDNTSSRKYNSLINDIENITIDDIDTTINFFNDLVVAIIKNNEISEVKYLGLTFERKDMYSLEIQEIPVTHYTLEQIKYLEANNLKKTKEPRILTLIKKRIKSR